MDFIIFKIIFEQASPIRANKYFVLCRMRKYPEKIFQSCSSKCRIIKLIIRFPSDTIESEKTVFVGQITKALWHPAWSNVEDTILYFQFTHIAWIRCVVKQVITWSEMVLCKLERREFISIPDPSFFIFDGVCRACAAVHTILMPEGSFRKKEHTAHAFIVTHKTCHHVIPFRRNILKGLAFPFIVFLKLTSFHFIEIAITACI